MADNRGILKCLPWIYLWGEIKQVKLVWKRDLFSLTRLFCWWYSSVAKYPAVAFLYMFVVALEPKRWYSRSSNRRSGDSSITGEPSAAAGRTTEVHRSGQSTGGSQNASRVLLKYDSIDAHCTSFGSEGTTQLKKVGEEALPAYQRTCHQTILFVFVFAFFIGKLILYNIIDEATALFSRFQCCWIKSSVSEFFSRRAAKFVSIRMIEIFGDVFARIVRRYSSSVLWFLA